MNLLRHSVSRFRVLALPIALALGARATSASGQPAPVKHPDWSERLKNIPLSERLPLTVTLSGQARWREEFFRAFNVGSQDDDYGVTRLMLGADVQAGRATAAHGRVLVEVRDAQALGRTLPGGTRSTDGDRHDIQNLYADVGFARSFVRYGRQEVSLGRERLVGVPDWANTRRGAEGTRIQLVRGSLMLDATDIRPMIVRLTRANVSDSTQRLRTITLGSALGAPAFGRGIPLQWQGYHYDQTITTATTQTRRRTTGARALWQFGTPKTSTRVMSFETEAAVQRGHTSVRDLHAWFWITEAQLQWRKARGLPTLAVGLEEASGDRAATARNETFTVLYPAAHQHGGFADVIGRPNVRELHLIGSWDPSAAVTLRGAWFRFDRRHLDDGVYNKQTTIFRAASGSRERHAADELDITGVWKATNHLRVLLGGALVLPGAFLTGTPGGAQVEHWGYVGTTYTF